MPRTGMADIVRRVGLMPDQVAMKNDKNGTAGIA
jgi:hypothetical protein